MPEGTKVGDAYIEVRPEYNAGQTPAVFAAMQRDIRRRLPDITSNIKQHFDSEMDKTGTSSGANFSRSLQRSLDRLNLRLPDLDIDVGSALAEIDRVQRELDEISRSNPTANVALDTTRARAELQALRAQIEASNPKVHVEVDTDPVKRGLKAALGEALRPDPDIVNNLVSILRTGVSRGLVQMFGSPIGAGIGAAFVAALGQAVVAGTVFLGAALTGAIIGGLGIGAIAAGIALVADDPQVKAAGDRIGEKLKTGLKDAAKPFRDEVVEALGILEGTIDKNMPRIKNIFADLSQHVVPLTQSVDKFINNALPGLENVLLNLDPVVAHLGSGIEQLGVKIGEAFNKLADPQVMEGAGQALEDIIGLLGEGIVLAADFLAGMSKLWLELRPHFVEFKRALNDLGIDGQFLRDVLGLLGTVILVNLMGPITNLTNAMKALKVVVDEVKSAWKDLKDDVNANVMPPLKAAWNDFKDDFQTNIVPVLKSGTGEVKSAWKDLKDDVNNNVIPPIKSAWKDLRDDFNNNIVPALKTGTAEVKSAWNDLKNDVNNNVVPGLKAAWKDFRDDTNVTLDHIKTLWRIFRDDINGIARELGVTTAWQNFRDTINNVMSSAQGAFLAFESVVIRVLAAAGVAAQAFGNALGLAAGVAKEAWNSLQGVISAVVEDIKSRWNSLTSSIGSTGGGFLEPVKAAWRSFRDEINSIFENIKSGFQIFLNMFRGGEGPITSFIQNVKAGFQSLRDDIAVRWNEIRSTVTQAMDQIRSSVENGWNTVREVTTRVIDTIRNSVQTGFGNIRSAITDAMNQVRSSIESSWNAIRGVFDQMINTIRGNLTQTFNSFRDSVRNTWNDILNAIRNTWNQIRDSVFNEINSRIDDLKRRFDDLKNNVSARWNEMRDTIRNVWNEIRTQVFEPMMDFIGNQIPAKYQEFKDRVIRIFSEVRDTIGRIWNEMINAAKTAVNTLASFINGVIKAINAIPFMKDKLGELPGFADGGAVIQGKARGGAISGGKPGTDTVPAMGKWGQPFLLDNGEHVLTRKDVQALGGQDAVYRFREALHKPLPAKFAFGGPIGMAAGGRVGPQNESLLQQHRDHVHVAMNTPPMGFPAIIAAAKASGIPHQVGSTFRPGSRGSGGGLDHHSEGRAVDFPGFNQDAFASYWEKLPGVIELIHRSATRDYAIFGGAGGGVVSGVISWLMSEAGKKVKAAFDAAMKKVRDFIGGDLLKGNTMAPGVLRNMFTNVADQLSSYFDFNASAGGGAAAPEQLKKWIEEAQKYVTIEDVGKLITLIMRESGGNPRAINLTDSNAAKGTPSKGLMQTIDPTFQAYRDKRLPNDPYDPVANIVAGMNYIHARYGSLHNVQQANAALPPKGYEGGGAINAVRVAMDRAGVIPPGSDAYIRNATSEHEYAMTASHMERLFGHGDDRDDDPWMNVNVYVDGVRRDARVEYEKQSRKVANTLRAGGRC